MKNSVITVQAQRDIELLMKVSKVANKQDAKDGSPANKSSEDMKQADDSMAKKYLRWKQSLYYV